MNPTELSFVQILEKYRDRDVQIVFKMGIRKGSMSKKSKTSLTVGTMFFS